MACQKWHNREHTTSWSEMGNRWDGRPWDHLCLLACHMMVARTQLIWCHNQHSVSCLGCTLIGCCLFNSHYLPTCFTVYLLLAFVQLFLSSMAFMMITTHKKKRLVSCLTWDWTWDFRCNTCSLPLFHETHEMLAQRLSLSLVLKSTSKY